VQRETPRLKIPQPVSIVHSNEGERSRLAWLKGERAPPGWHRWPGVGRILGRARTDRRIYAAETVRKNDERKTTPILDDYRKFKCSWIVIDWSRRLDLDCEARMGEHR
jgi:hypothetical protein